MKRIVGTLMIFLLILTLTSCTATPTNSQSSKLKLVKKNFKTKYLIANGIKLDYDINTFNLGTEVVSLNMPRFTGLKDLKLEEKINNTIKTEIAEKIKDYIKESNNADGLSCIASVNANNLLSIVLYDIRIGISGTPVSALLYNLTNGKRIYLSDIFTKGTDYISLLNQKITLAILSGETDEENLLREPFTSINANPDFALTESTLYIIFHADESGFVRRTAIEIPLSKIDDYVDILDNSLGNIETQNNYLYTNLMFKRNNIFFDSKGEVLKTSKGKFMISYPIISGIQNQSFQREVNATLVKKVKEFVNDKYLNHTTTSLSPFTPISEISMFVGFNSYGILSFQRYGRDMLSGVELSPCFSVLSFDLSTNKPLNLNNIFINYKMKNRDFEKLFTDHIKQAIITQNSYLTSASKKKISSNINFEYIIKNAILNFYIYQTNEDMQITFLFNKDLQKGIPSTIYCNFPLRDVVKETPEDFLNAYK